MNRETGDLPLPLLFRGKVRDVYALPANGQRRRLLLLASDRVSAFDVVMRERVRDKGRVLTQITAWWLRHHLAGQPHHLITANSDDIAREVPVLAARRSDWDGRASLVWRTRPVPVECVVRGYLSGSAWREYREAGTLAGEPLAPGLEEHAALSPPLFSPATKAARGHDENIPFGRMIELLGETLAHRLRDRSLAIYERGRAAAARAGIIVADTKLEFGIAGNGEVLLIDEVLTPDSSRFWPLEHYRSGRPQPSLDKQPVRDYLAAQPDWNKTAPPPPLPPAVTQAASNRYRELFQRLTNAPLDHIDGGSEPGTAFPSGQVSA